MQYLTCISFYLFDFVALDFVVCWPGSEDICKMDFGLVIFRKAHVKLFGQKHQKISSGLIAVLEVSITFLIFLKDILVVVKLVNNLCKFLSDILSLIT